MGNQRREESSHDQESQLQRNHYGILEFLRRDLFTRTLDALGHAKLRERPAHANDGNGAWGSPSPVSKRAHGNSVWRKMSPLSKTKMDGNAAGLSSEKRLHDLVQAVMRLGKAAGAEETEVHLDETLDALT